MKNRILFFLVSVFLGAAMLYSCHEEPVGQTSTNSTPPGKITNPSVENLPGGARISYTLPADDDLLYVKAVYYINGVEKSAASTLYVNSVEVMGFGSTDEQSVWLYCVDRSGNQSEAEEVKINPTTPPVMLIHESMQMYPNFGGIGISWKNEFKTPIAIYVLAADSVGDIQVADVVYTGVADGRFSLRGFPDTERIFGAYVRDRWDNFSDTLLGAFTPFYEELLDKKKFRPVVLPGDNNNPYPMYPMEGMWDDSAAEAQYQMYIQISHPAGTPNFFTFELGAVAKLSRYTLWQRLYPTLVYSHTNLKKWKLYGSAELKPTTDLDYWTEGWKDDWFLLADSEIIKPSGNLPVVTQDDMDAAHAGHNFDIDIDAPPVRYIRFFVESTWSGSLECQIAEITFWGQELE